MCSESYKHSRYSGNVEIQSIQLRGTAKNSVDTAKKLCKTRTLISTSYKWFTLGITL